VKKNRKLLLRISILLASLLLIFSVLAMLLPKKEAVPDTTKAPDPVPRPYPTLKPNPYTPEDFYYEGDYLVCSAAQTVMGIDVSRYQKQVDWNAVAQAGVEFVMVRLGNRGIGDGQLYEDEFAQQNLDTFCGSQANVGTSQQVFIADKGHAAVADTDIFRTEAFHLKFQHTFQTEMTRGS
jgi:hypothetical protein